MRKLFYLFASLLLISVLPACKKENTSKTISITGNWSLQKERIVTYVNNMVENDTTYVTSAKSRGNVLFNTDLTYSCNAQFIIPQSTSSINGSSNVAIDNVSGTYNINNSALNLTNGLIGFLNDAVTGSAGPQGPQGLEPPVTLYTSEITLLTLSNLYIHTETGYSLSVNNVISNIRTETYYYYSK